MKDIRTVRYVCLDDGTKLEGHPVRLMMIERERGDLFAVRTFERTLLVQIEGPLDGYPEDGGNVEGYFWYITYGPRGYFYLSVGENSSPPSTRCWYLGHPGPTGS